MPQMMPINWLISLFFFILIFITFNILNYYIFNDNNKTKIKSFFFNIKNLSWKW